MPFVRQARGFRQDLGVVGALDVRLGCDEDGAGSADRGERAQREGDGGGTSKLKGKEIEAQLARQSRDVEEQRRRLP